MDAQHIDEPALYAPRPAAYAPDPVATHRHDPDERHAARWLLPMAAVTAILVLAMIWYFAARQY